VILGNGDGTFGGTQMAAGFGSSGMLVAADFDHDGHIDLCDGQALALGKGDGTFQTPVPLYALGTPGPTGVAAADLDNDGKLDVVVSQAAVSSGQLKFGINQGGGSFSMTSVGLQVFSAPVLGDFDLDGRPDVALAVTQPSYYAEPVIYSIVGGTALGASLLPPHDPDPGSFLIGDFDQDGRVDLVIESDLYLNRAQ
jgi:hypothetical protein